MAPTPDTDWDESPLEDVRNLFPDLELESMDDLSKCKPSDLYDDNYFQHNSEITSNYIKNEFMDRVNFNALTIQMEENSKQFAENNSSLQLDIALNSLYNNNSSRSDDEILKEVFNNLNSRTNDDTLTTKINFNSRSDDDILKEVFNNLNSEINDDISMTNINFNLSSHNETLEEMLKSFNSETYDDDTSRIDISSSTETDEDTVRTDISSSTETDNAPIHKVDHCYYIGSSTGNSPVSNATRINVSKISKTERIVRKKRVLISVNAEILNCPALGRQKRKSGTNKRSRENSENSRLKKCKHTVKDEETRFRHNQSERERRESLKNGFEVLASLLTDLTGKPSKIRILNTARQCIKELKKQDKKLEEELLKYKKMEKVNLKKLSKLIKLRNNGDIP